MHACLGKFAPCLIGPITPCVTGVRLAQIESSREPRIWHAAARLDVDAKAVAGMLGERLSNPELRELAWVLFSGVREYRALLDEKIESVAENWKLSRMAATDRNCLRLGAFDVLETSTPHRVVIDEALALAH